MIHFCVFCGNRRDPGKGRHGRGAAERLRKPSADRCAEDVETTAVRFDGVTGERLDPPPMPRRSLLTSSGDMGHVSSGSRRVPVTNMESGQHLKRR